MLKRIAISLLLLAGLAQAHDFWLEPGIRKATLRYGHGSEEADYKADELKKVLALDSQGQPVAVESRLEQGKMHFAWQGPAVVLATEVDNGIWCKTTQGWEQKSRKQCPGALIAQHSLYYAKAALQPESCLNQRLGHPLEMILLEVAPTQVRVRVLLDGKPVPDLKIYSAHDSVGRTDEAGELRADRNGLLVLSCSLKQECPGNPEVDRFHYGAVLSL
jgi:nickel transport protein